MISSLLRSDPTVILRIIGSSRSAVTPWTYCGVTAVSSTTTPAALVVARPAAAPTSSIEAAAIRASAATSSRSANSPPAMPSSLPSGHDLLRGAGLDLGLHLGLHLVLRGGQVDRVPDVPLGVTQRVDQLLEPGGDGIPREQQREADGTERGDAEGQQRVAVGPGVEAGV